MQLLEGFLVAIVLGQRYVKEKKIKEFNLYVLTLSINKNVKKYQIILDFLS